MKFVSNAGTDRVLDLVRPWLRADNGLDVVSPTLSLFAFAEVLADAAMLSNVRLVLPAAQTTDGDDLGLLGNAKDRAARNKLQGPWLARKLAGWLEQKTNVRQASGGIPQGTLVLRDASGTAQQAVLGSFSFSTELEATPEVRPPVRCPSGTANSFPIAGLTGNARSETGAQCRSRGPWRRAKARQRTADSVSA